MESHKVEPKPAAEQPQVPAPSLQLLEGQANRGFENPSSIQRLRTNQPARLSSSDVLRLQQSIGNQAVVRLLNQRNVTSNNVARQRKPQENKTGLPDQLKAGVENLSGHSLDDVQVHYNSPEPDQIMAHSYTKGAEIFIGPGREQDLPHEAWHVVQQKQGRVAPASRIQARGQKVNLDDGLEIEADIMGARAAQPQPLPAAQPGPARQPAPVAGGVIQGNWRIIVQGIKKSGFFQGMAKGFIKEVGKEEAKKLLQEQYEKAVKKLEEKAFKSIQDSLNNPALKNTIGALFTLKAAKDIANGLLLAMVEPIAKKINQRVGRALLWMQEQVPELGLNFEIKTPLPGLLGKIKGFFNLEFVKDLVSSLGQAAIMEGLKKLIAWADKKALQTLKNQAMEVAKSFVGKGSEIMMEGINGAKLLYKTYAESGLKTLKDLKPKTFNAKGFGEKGGEKLAQYVMNIASKNGYYNTTKKGVDVGEKALKSVSGKEAEEINLVGEQLKSKGVSVSTVIKVVQFLTTWMELSSAERTSDKIQVLARPALIAIVSLVGVTVLPTAIVAALPASIVTIAATAAVIMLKKHIDAPLKYIADYLEIPLEKLGYVIASTPLIGPVLKNAYIGFMGIGNYLNLGYAKAKYSLLGDKEQLGKDQRLFNRQMKRLTGQKIAKEDMEPTTESELLKVLDDVTLKIDMSGSMDSLIPKPEGGEKSGKTSPLKGLSLTSYPLLKGFKSSNPLNMKMLGLTHQQSLPGKSDDSFIDIESLEESPVKSESASDPK